MVDDAPADLQIRKSGSLFARLLQFVLPEGGEPAAEANMKLTFRFIQRYRSGKPRADAYIGAVRLPSVLSSFVNRGREQIVFARGQTSVQELNAYSNPS